MENQKEHKQCKTNKKYTDKLNILNLIWFMWKMLTLVVINGNIVKLNLNYCGVPKTQTENDQHIHVVG